MKSQAWEELTKNCINCDKCELSKTRANVVVGTGSKSAEIIFIGEAPGKNEDIQGEPFVGKSGKLFDQMIGSIGLSRNHNIYIANMVKCRPPENRDPLPAETELCLDWLKTQISLINPKIIVCVGRVAACRLIKPDFKVTKEHGVFFDKNGILMMGIFHPAAILRNPRQKPEVYSDLLKLRDKIEEICTKTRLIFSESES